jgi:uncharacterized protein (DUF1684 family)
MDIYNDELRKWQQEQNLALTGKRGWLRLSSLYWLDDENNISLVDICPRLTGSLNSPLGHLTLGEDKFTFHPAIDQITLDGIPLKGEVNLPLPESDSDQTFAVGPLEFILIRREEKMALRVWDSQSEEAARFTGRIWFPADPNWIIRGERQQLNKHVLLAIPNALGGLDNVSTQALFHFKRDGKEIDLYAVNQGEDRLFIIFTDTHDSTYPAGRYVTALKDDEGWYIDFNRAANPPCAVTAFATCPYAPAQNRLDFSIPAGEKYNTAKEVNL